MSASNLFRGALHCAIAVVCVMMLTAAPARAGTIYYDSFAGSSGSSLHSSVPDTTSGSATWVSHAAWNADGTIGPPPGTSEHANAFLPFSPQAGQQYRLSMDANVTGGDHNWFALGFAQDAVVNESFHNTTSAQPAGWMLLRHARGPLRMDSFLGPRTQGAAQHDAPDGWVNLQVILDTTQPQWSAEWFVNGTAVRGPDLFATNPTINYVGFARFENATGAVDNFTLTAIPEPAAAGSVAAGLIGLLLRRTRAVA